MALPSHIKTSAHATALSPFRVRSFRLQWPADLAVSWAFDMETIILSWYVLTEARSVLMLTLFASLQYLGTLLAPMFGVMGDRVGHRQMLTTMRAMYTLLALTLMTLAYSGMLTPTTVLAIASLMGLVRPSDAGMRTALVGATVPRTTLMGAMSIQRTTQDSAKVAGALSGAGAVALLGIGPAYAVVASLYALSTMLTWMGASAQAVPCPAPPHLAPTSPLGDLRAGLAYVWHTPLLFAAMCWAFVLNCTAFPMMNGLIPIMAKNIYHTDQTGLSYLVASGGCGALLSAVVMGHIGHRLRPARAMLLFGAGWYLALMLFAHTTTLAMGIPLLMLAGLSQGLGQTAMATMLIRSCEAHFRGRLMGIRMLMIYGNIPGLILAGWLIPRLGYPLTATLYGVLALLLGVIVTLHWRPYLWQREAPANGL
ncbi:MAG: MFS transporter [Candidatus Tectimicrobiota bacterium]